jgi:putative intracellular protease/amidase
MAQVVAFFQPGWADWEAGTVLALLREEFGGVIRIATPGGGPETSIGGVRAAADAAFAEIGPDDADVFLAIGSDAWPAYRDEAFFDLLRRALAADRIVGAICAATVAAARAGLLEARAHTSNGRDWLLRHAPAYAGHGAYVDMPSAVTDGKLVTAAGLAPGTFAGAILRLVAPEHAKAIAAHERDMAREWSTLRRRSLPR